MTGYLCFVYKTINYYLGFVHIMSANDYKQTDWAAEHLCPVCSSPLPESKSRPFVYCTNACKFKAFRQRDKAQRILVVSEKPQRISKKRHNLIQNLPTAEKVVGVSGTVHAFPVAPQKTVTPPSVAPVIRTVADLEAFFNS